MPHTTAQHVLLFFISTSRITCSRRLCPVLTLNVYTAPDLKNTVGGASRGVSMVELVKADCKVGIVVSGEYNTFSCFS